MPVVTVWPVSELSDRTTSRPRGTPSSEWGFEFAVGVVRPVQSALAGAARAGDGAAGLQAELVVLVGALDVARVGGGLEPAVVPVGHLRDVADGLPVGGRVGDLLQAGGRVVGVDGDYAKSSRVMSSISISKPFCCLFCSIRPASPGFQLMCT